LAILGTLVWVVCDVVNGEREWPKSSLSLSLYDLQVRKKMSFCEFLASFIRGYAFMHDHQDDDLGLSRFRGMSVLCIVSSLQPGPYYACQRNIALASQYPILRNWNELNEQPLGI
jgi:hypothetical protein